jgi:hypothetical protein
LVDGYNVLRIRDALEAGAKLLPIIADKKTNMVVDGFHRIKAYQMLYGVDVDIEVEYREYENIREIFLESIKLNNIHGKPLSLDDKLRVRDVSRELRIKPEYIAGVLSMTVERVKNLGVENPGIIEVVPFEKKESPAVRRPPKPVKTKVQLYNIRSVIKLIESNKIDLDNSEVKYELNRLKLLLDGLFVAK